MHLVQVATATYTLTMEEPTMWLDTHRRLIADIFFMIFVFWMAFLLMPQIMAKPWLNVPKLIVVEKTCE